QINQVFLIYKNESDNGGKIPDKISRSNISPVCNSFLKTKVARSAADMLIGFEKSTPMIPYSWQKTIRKKNQKFERNPYSWMNNQIH
uniref:Uncharacterized protein n=1 Tax=Onchocerca volvulus TaxID=6282 RepID=A0A8R1XXK4_ONCVO